MLITHFSFILNHTQLILIQPYYSNNFLNVANFVAIVVLNLMISKQIITQTIYSKLTQIDIPTHSHAQTCTAMHAHARPHTAMHTQQHSNLLVTFG